MSDFNQSCSFNRGIAEETSIEAALVFDEINFWTSKTKRSDGFVYKTLEELAERIPVKPMTIRRSIEKLIEAGYIEKQIKRANAKTVMHFRVLGKLRFVQNEQSVDVQNEQSIGMSKLNNPLTATNTSTINKQKALLEILNRITGRTFRTLPRGSKKLLDLFTLVEIESSLRSLCADAWHHDKIRELSSDYLLRATTIDKFLSRETTPTYQNVEDDPEWQRQEKANEEFRKS